MRNTAKKLQGFTLMEMLIVLSIVIILSAVGISGFNSINETFTANENAELVKQDIESARLKAMNMGKESEETWVYGFGIDFRNADSSNGRNENYRMYKWCSPIKNFGDTLILEGTSYDLTRAKLPNLYSGSDVGDMINANLCGTLGTYKNGSIPASCGSSGYLDGCLENTTNLSAVFGEDLSLLNRFDGQVVLLDLEGEGNPPSFVFFESLTGKAIIYARNGEVLNYNEDGTFKADDFVPLDIILRRKSNSDTFDMISVYPLSGEIIHHVYGSKDKKEIPSECGENLSCFTFGGNTYERYGIDDEIKSYRD